MMRSELKNENYKNRISNDVFLFEKPHPETLGF